MKKTIIKMTFFIVVFIVSLVAISKIMNRGNENLTMEMAPATLPVVTMLAKTDVSEADAGRKRLEGFGPAIETGKEAEIGMIPYAETIAYNQLQGYCKAMDTAYQRETITQLGAAREAYFVVDTFGATINNISIEVRSTDGSRLVEATQVTDRMNGNAGLGAAIGNRDATINCSISLKDLIEKDREYILVILLDTEEAGVVRYYTRIVWSDKTYVVEKLSFAREFHDLLYDRAAAKERNIAKYLESNSSGNNTSFHKVNIHSSFSQITWGDLNVTEVTEPVIQLTELGSQTGTMVLKYIVSTTEDKTETYYQVEEAFRVRFLTNADRMYLLDYERTMTQIPQVKSEIYQNNKIMLGIVDENLQITESTDGNVVLFEAAGRLCCYNMSTNKMTVLFCFYDKENVDARSLYGDHAMKVLDVDEGGDVSFAVYGYMNRGRHEGELGIQVYYFDNSLNTVEEIIYIPSDKSFDLLAAEMDRLLYLNRENQLYLMLDNTVFVVDLEEKTGEELVTITRDTMLGTSDNHKVLAWQEGTDSHHGSALHVFNLGNGTHSKIDAEEGTAIKLLGFMEEDVIYGLARLEDITEDITGKLFFPIYKICICDAEGNVLKESGQNNIYVTDCQITEGQITLRRVLRMENGTYAETTPDYIMINEEAKTGKNKLAVVNIDIYQKYVQIQTRLPINESKLQVRSPKEVVFEGGRELNLTAQTAVERYYVYNAWGLSTISASPAFAIEQAYEEYGTVVDDHGNYVWRRGNLVTRNQIMAITKEKADESRSSLAVCLDAILKKEGVSNNTQALLYQGKTAAEILQEELENIKVLDLTGLSLDAILYYVNQDIPVLAHLTNGEAVLVTGFNEYNVVILDPSTGKLGQKGRNDATEWFEENGNCFLTYMYNKQ